MWESMQDNPTKRMSFAAVILYVLTIVLLAICLIVSSLTLAYSNVLTDSVLYSTGLKLDFNGGKPVIDENVGLDFSAPGETTVSTFFLENQSDEDVYYRLYFTDVRGALAEVMEVEIYLGDRLLYSGLMTEMARENTVAADDILKLRDHRDFTIRFNIAEEAGDEYQGTSVTFRLAAEVTQVRDNPDKLF